MSTPDRDLYPIDRCTRRQLRDRIRDLEAENWKLHRRCERLRWSLSAARSFGRLLIDRLARAKGGQGQ